MIPFSRQKIPVKCTKCGRINFARRDYLKRSTHPYWCKYCKPHWEPETFEDRLRLSRGEDAGFSLILEIGFLKKTHLEMLVGQMVE